MSGQMYRFCVRLLATVSLLTFSMSGPALGKVIYVDDDANAPGDGKSWATAYRYLQDALADAKAAEKPAEIRVARGVYKPDEGANQKAGDRLASLALITGVAISGGYAGIGMGDPNARDVQAHKTVLSGDLASNDTEVMNPRDLKDEPSRAENSCHVVTIVRASQARLEGVTITGGNANIFKGRGDPFASTTSGGGIQGETYQDVALNDCIIVGNCAAVGPGGASINSTGSVAVNRCVFTRNSGGRGGLAIGKSGVTLSGCEISGNYSTADAGGMIASGHITVIDCVFSANMAPPGGGGAVNLFEANARFTRCTFRDNSAREGGGLAISDEVKWAAYRFEGCSFSGNHAGTIGGAISFYSYGPIDLANCILSGNTAKEGGAIYGSSFAKLEVLNCTASDNRAGKGQFASLDSQYLASLGHAVIGNSIIAGNDKAIYTKDFTVSLAYTLLRAGRGSVTDPNNVVWGLGNMTVDPCFAAPGYWDAKGTLEDPNDDLFVAGDYHLKSQGGRWDPKVQSWVRDNVTSPCIDAGDPNSPIGLELFPNGGRINMGAYGGTAEASKSYFGGPPCEKIIPGDINGDCKVDLIDLAILARHWLETN